LSPGNKSIRVPGEDQSNQVGEMAAILYLLEDVSPYAPLRIYTDSKYVIEALTEYQEEWERNGYIGIKNADLIKAVVAKLRERGSETRFKWVKGHSGIVGNEGADKLAGAGADKAHQDGINLAIKDQFDVAGAQLSTITQALAYKALIEKKDLPRRNGTIATLDMTRHAVKDNFGYTPNDERIWKSIVNKDVRRTVRTYLWKTMHRSYKIGQYWRNIPGWEHREKCQVCGEEESMEHILLECDDPSREAVWDLAKNLWEKKAKKWPELRNIGHILACTLAEIKDDEGKGIRGASRLYRIIITESAHLIWRMRNKRFGEPDKEKWPTVNETENTWTRTINQRLDLDKAMTDPKFETKAIPKSKVISTWKNTLMNEKELPEDWTKVREVLVGSTSKHVRRRVHSGHDPPT
ncbi:hypothetical protein HWV62_5646, partial [Athelia sp. TMB]